MTAARRSDVSRSPMLKVMDLFRHRSNSAVSEADKRKAVSLPFRCAISRSIERPLRLALRASFSCKSIESALRLVIKVMIGIGKEEEINIVNWPAVGPKEVKRVIHTLAVYNVIQSRKYFSNLALPTLCDKKNAKLVNNARYP